MRLDLGCTSNAEDTGPESLHIALVLHRAGENLIHVVRALECQNGVSKGVIGETVTLGADDKEGSANLPQEVQKLCIRGLRRDIRVHQADTESKLSPFGQIGIDEGLPLRRDGFRDFGITVAGKIGKEDLRQGIGIVIKAKEIDRAGAARRR